MKQVAIVVDSTACLTPEQIKRHEIIIVPANFFFEGKSYRDGVDISSSEAYRMLERSPDSFSASPPSPSEFLDAFQKASQQAQSIFCLTVSRKVSTFYNVARMAGERFRKNSPDTAIEVFDSENVAAGEGLIALAVAHAAAIGADLGEVRDLAERLRGEVKLVAFLDTTHYVHRTGRVPKTLAQMGSLLRVKPLFSVSDGAIHFRGIVRTRKRAISRLMEMAKAEVGNQPIKVAVMHAAAEEGAEKLKERLSAKFDCREIWVTEFSPLMGYSSGPGTLGFACCPFDAFTQAPPES